MPLNDKEKAAQFRVRHAHQSFTDRYARVRRSSTDRLLAKGPWDAANRTPYKDAYRDSTYEQIGALSGFIVPLILHEGISFSAKFV